MTKRTMPVLTTKEFGIKIVTRIDYKGHTVRLASTSEIPEIENTFIVGRDIVKALCYSYKTNIPSWCNNNFYEPNEVLLLEDAGPGNKNIFWVALKKLRENIKPLANPKLAQFVNEDMFKDPMKLLNLFTKEEPMENNDTPVEQIQDMLVENLQKHLRETREELEAAQKRNRDLTEKINELYKEKTELEQDYNELVRLSASNPVETHTEEPVLTMSSLLEFMRLEKVQVSIKPL